MGTCNGKIEQGRSTHAKIEYFPYFEGPPFVKELMQQGGWQAVNNAYVNLPKSTEQIIHPEKYLVDEPVEVNVNDTSSDSWTVLGRDELGEFAIFVMFWNQGLAWLGWKDGGYTYSSRASDGWGGDEMVVYQNGSRYGYVWKIIWDSEQDAKEFMDAYEWMLCSMNATYIGGTTISRSSSRTAQS